MILMLSLKEILNLLNIHRLGIYDLTSICSVIEQILTKNYGFACVSNRYNPISNVTVDPNVYRYLSNLLNKHYLQIATLYRVEQPLIIDIGAINATLYIHIPTAECSRTTYHAGFAFYTQRV